MYKRRLFIFLFLIGVFSLQTMGAKVFASSDPQLKDRSPSPPPLSESDDEESEESGESNGSENNQQLSNTEVESLGEESSESIFAGIFDTVLLSNIGQPMTIYSRMGDNYRTDGGKFWSTLGYKHIRANKTMKDNIAGILLGFDYPIFSREGIVGIYGGYDGHFIGREEEKARINSMSMGFYGGLVKESFDVKLNLAMARNSFNIDRNYRLHEDDEDEEPDKFNSTFTGYNFIIDGEVGIRCKVDESLLLRPFLGIQSAIVTHGSFNETGPMANSRGVEVASAKHFLTMGRLGVSLANTAGAFGPFGFHVDLDGRFRIANKNDHLSLTRKSDNAAKESKIAANMNFLFAVNTGIDYNLPYARNKITLAYDIGYQGNSSVHVFGTGLSVKFKL
ncbi:MAG: autotransporter outer membrane beta-barrel domain-containing protein [Rickettsiales bacterium]|jgi:hypothetical protein|nr:autotransporter outer membrane beta-barrel domain-containing protein [Rickettsiales bacterium]